MNRIVNVDESDWRTVASGFLTWAEKGAESVHCQFEDDKKSGVTVIAAITTDSMKLPRTIIWKVKTPGFLAGYELTVCVDGDFSLSGWTNTDVICRHLHGLRSTHFTDYETLIIILDTYSAHRATIM
jgi:hypothetical protein